MVRADVAVGIGGHDPPAVDPVVVGVGAALELSDRVERRDAGPPLDGRIAAGRGRPLREEGFIVDFARGRGRW